MTYINSFIDFPSELLDRITGASITSESGGKSAANVYKIRKPDKTVCYLKTQKIEFETELVKEVIAYDFLEKKIKAPYVIYYDIFNNTEYMLCSLIDGAKANLRSILRKPEIMIKAIALALKALHSIDITDCEIDSRLDFKLQKAKQRVDRNLVEIYDFEPQNKGMLPIEIYNELVKTKPEVEDLVFTHGDYTLSNIIINDENEVGLIDMGRGGIADKYQDISIILRDLKARLEDNEADKYIKLFLKTYGIDNLDIQKLKYYILLDELF